jgi:hypothetical protein
MQRPAGVLALLAAAAACAAGLREPGARAYLDAVLGVVGAAAVLGAVLLLVRDDDSGWWLSLTVGLPAALGYLTSRVVGLPGASAAIGHWDSPAGSTLLAASVLAVMAAAAGLRYGRAHAPP